MQILLIGGASGTGKSSVGWELSALLERRGVAHCVIDGDSLGHVFPAPVDDPSRSAITERNLASIWSGFAALGQTRLVFTNTVSVLQEEMVCRAVAGDRSPSVEVTRVVLVASEETVAARLAVREVGSQLDVHVDRSRRAAVLLAQRAPAGTVTVVTDGREVDDIAGEVLAATGW